jgi:hypothetical protein
LSLSGASEPDDDRGYELVLPCADGVFSIDRRCRAEAAIDGR